MNAYGKIAHYFIDNKKLSFLIMLGIILWGIISFIIIPKQYNPNIVAPAFLIDVDFPGATADEVYQIVTKPFENVLNEIRGVEHIYSKSFQGGHASVIVQFYVGEDLEKSMITLRQKISSRLNLSPLGVDEPCLSSIDPDDLPIKTLALYSDHVDPVTLRKRAFFLREELKHVNGASYIDVIGGRKREFQILLNPQKMKETKTSLNEIHDALNNTSLLKTLGLIKTPEKYYSIETQEQVVTTADIENIIIISNVEQILRIKDVADVIEGEEEYTNYVGFFKKDVHSDHAVFITVAKKKGENIITVSKNIDQKVNELKGRSPHLDDVTIETVKDEGRVASEEIYGLVINLIQAICIVFVILFIFLNYRAAILVALSIPMTLLTVIALGNLFGYTINRITLFALILSLGMLVDSATVVIENIVKNKRKNPNVPKSSLIVQSVSEVGMGLFLSTVTTVLAFIPMLFVTGMMGPYMGPLPFFVSCALIVSLFFAYSLNPWLAFVMCKETIPFEDKKHCNLICTLSKNILSGYRNFLSTLFSNKRKRALFLTTCFIILLMVILFPLFTLVRFRMLPKANREQMYVYIDLDRGTSLERTHNVAMAFTDILKQQPHVKSIQSFVGVPPVLDFNGLFKGVSLRTGSHQITLKLNVTHPRTRKIKSEDLAYSYRETLEEYTSRYPDARIQIIEDPPGPPVRSTFFVKVKCENPELLYSVAYDLEGKVKNIKGVEDIDISVLEEHDKYILSVDKRAAADAKVSVDRIARELETIFSGKVIGVYHSDYNYEQEYIVLKFDRDLRDSIDDLDNIFIANQLGNHVPVSRFVNAQKVFQEDVITGDDRERAIYISGEMAKRSVTYAAIDLLKMLYRYTVPHTKTELTHWSLLKSEYRVDNKERVGIEIGGEWDLTVKVFRDLGLAMIVAIILIYLILVAQFKSFLIPILILGTIPLALIGVMPGFAVLFYFFNVYFSATSMIGVIALAGIVVNNAIIFLEYTMQTAAGYNSLHETLLDAGLTRMRPILLTSTTTVLGSLVIAFDPVWSGLAWSIVFGLSLSSLLTLIVFPTLIYQFLGDTWFRMVKSKTVK